MRVLGFMSGTSLDAVDMAVLETDGVAIQAFGPAGERKLSPPTREIVQEATRQALAWPRGATEPAVFAEAARAVALEHLEAAREFMAAHGLKAGDLDLVGFHGQTVSHQRPQAGRVGRTVQLGDAALLADGLGVPVVCDLRIADVAAGGEGAPLAPIYHAALAAYSGLKRPVGALNLGGVANITLVGERDGDLKAFDTGPANGMIDMLVQQRGAGRFDDGGRLAMAGTVDETALDALLNHPYFAAPPPKSLDRYDFPLDPVRALSLEDAAATLTAFTIETVRRALSWITAPSSLIVCGGGRHNPAIMAKLRQDLPLVVMSAEDAGWRGDSIEAEAFAYLAARSSLSLPISFPGTTGVLTPMTGGRTVRPGKRFRG
jgi:anhydro-N-acetylmuramic acid kinase